MSKMDNMPFSERASMKDVAEQKTKEDYESGGYTIVPLGFSQMHRVKEKGFYDAWMKIPRILRNMPDILLIKEVPQVVEIKGFYRVLKMKVNDFKSYVWWHRIFGVINIPLYFNLYSLNSESHYLVPFLDMNNLMEDAYRKSGIYEGNNEEYKEIDIREVEKYCVR